ncbi:MAG: extracellular solute-binding protein [Dehalococcoidales bacterium]|nr:extracellular solute-binding protein [Dehalococcoidales bacterium]
MSRLAYHKMTRRRLLKGAVLGFPVFAAGALIGACAPAAAPVPTAKPEATKPQQTTGAPTQAPAKPAGTVTLETWTHFAGANLEVLNQFLGEFKKDNADIELNLVAVGAGEIQAKLLTAVAGGAPPDVYHLPGNIPPELARDKVLAPLDDIVKLPVPILKAFDGATIREGRQYGIAVQGGLGAMAYNKDLLDAAGVTKVPDTWDELVDAGLKVTKAGQGQWGIAFPNAGDSNTAGQVRSLLMAAGSDVMTPDLKQPAFNTPEMLETFQFGVDLVQKYKVNPQKSYAQLQTYNDYTTGKFGACMLFPAWLLQLKTGKFKTVTAEMPKRKTRGTAFAGNYWTLLAAVKDPGKQQAFSRLVAWWTDPKNNSRWCAATYGLPTTEATVKTDVYQKFLKEDPNAKAFVDSMAYASATPPVIGISGVLLALARAWEAAVLGNTAPKDALAAGQKEAADALAKAQR